MEMGNGVPNRKRLPIYSRSAWVLATACLMGEGDDHLRQNKNGSAALAPNPGPHQRKELHILAPPF
jgi:hypothetical protein